MRVASFRDDVLWPLAFKAGLDPVNELLTDEGRALVSFLNAWMRRSWDDKDFQEWTSTKEFTPDASHLVPYHVVPVGESLPVTLSRVLKVYLLDPRTNRYPVDTRFREWDEGVWCGFDHGATVFIKYQDRPPWFVADKWDASRVYNKAETTYSNRSGECYKSLVANNQGNDPVLGFLTAIPTEITQQAEPGQAGHDAQPEIIDAVAVPFTELPPAGPAPPTPIPPPVGAVWKMVVQPQDGSSTLATVTYGPATSTTTWNDVIQGLLSALSAAPGMAGFTFTNISTNKTLRLQGPMDFKLATWSQSSAAGTSSINLKRVQGQVYIPAVPSTPPISQITQVTLSQDMAKDCTTYTLQFHDLDGGIHTASYYAEDGESLQQIVLGMAGAITGSIDPWLPQNLSTSVDPTNGILQIFSMGGISTDASMEPDTNTYWQRVLFPYALIEPVVRGAYSDWEREGGQTDKAMAEEQGAVQEQQDRAKKALAPGYTDLTDQRAPAPRFQGKMGGG